MKLPEASFKLSFARRLVGGALLLLAGCSFAPIRTEVPDLELPGNSSQGLVCYTPSPVEAAVPANFSGADYRATALYTSAGTQNVAITVYGRTTPPPSLCVTPTAADLPLSGPLTLTPGVPQEVLIGGPDYGGTLADLLTEPSYYVGASLSGGVLESTQERIRLTGGTVSVYY